MNGQEKENTEYLVEIGEKIAQLSSTVKEIDGRKYSVVSLHEIRKPKPESLKVESLSSLAEYISNKPDGITPDKAIVHVVDPIKVSLKSNLRADDFFQRDLLMTAEYETKGFRFDTFMMLEPFIIGLQANFIMDDNLKSFLEKISVISDVRETTVSDSGVHQEVLTKSGVVTKGNAKVDSQISLTPRRTFPEVDQVLQQFVVRIQKQGESLNIGLFEADGGAWKIQAMQNIKDYLSDKLPDWTILA